MRTVRGLSMGLSRTVRCNNRNAFALLMMLCFGATSFVGIIGCGVEIPGTDGPGGTPSPPPPSGFTLIVATSGQGRVDVDYSGGADNVIITAVPETGWIFNRWEGDVNGGNNPETLVMDQDRSVRAVFVELSPPGPYSLFALKEGEGTVVVDPAAPEYEAGTQVSVRAIPVTGWQFDHWERDLSGSENPVAVTMNQDRMVKAVFTLQKRLTVNIEGQGSVNIYPAEGTYNDGTQVTLTATAGNGWRFHHWDGDLGGDTNPATVTMDGDRTVTAVFVRLYDLTIDVEGSGLVQTTPSGTTFDAGTEVLLTATAADGWRFDHWIGDVAGTSDSAAVTMNSDKMVTAVFVQLSG